MTFSDVALEPRHVVEPVPRRFGRRSFLHNPTVKALYIAGFLNQISQKKNPDFFKWIIRIIKELNFYGSAV